MTAEPVGPDGELGGPVYMVSVAGSKMYALAERAADHSHRAAEATQLYQVVDVSADQLSMRVYTPTGRLYDGFDIVRGVGGRTAMHELPDSVLVAERRCEGDIGPDGAPCQLLSKRIAFGR